MKELFSVYLASLWYRAVNCLDRHVHTCPEKVALIWERDEPGSEVKVTYRSAVWPVRVYGLLWRNVVHRALCASLQAATGDDVSPWQPVEAARREEGGLRHHLHAPVPFGSGVHVGVRSYRRGAQCGVCRLQCGGPGRASQRR